MSRSSIWLYHGARASIAMNREEYVTCIDKLTGRPSRFRLGEGHTVLHDQKIGELLDHKVDKWDHIIFRRAHQNANRLIDAGDNPLRLVGDAPGMGWIVTLVAASIG